MTAPLVTIAIPSYNHAKYISETIQSALDQTFQDFEILVVDDASTDNSVEVIKSFNDPRIRLIESTENRGVCYNSNVCIENASGKYIALVASDDVMEKTKLEKQVNFLEQNSNYKAVFSGIEIIDENGKTNKKKTKKYTKIFEKENRHRFEWLNYFFHHGNCIAAPSLLGRTDVLRNVGNFNQALIQAHDFDFWVRLCLQGYEIYIIHEKLLKYRERNNNRNLSSNTSETRIRLLFDNEKVLKNFLKIASLADFIKIFPDSSKPLFQPSSKQEERIIIDYLIFREAYKNIQNHYHAQFAINLLYDTLQKDGAGEILNKNFGFDFKEYKKIVTQNPLGVLLEEHKKSISRKILDSILKFKN